MNAVAAALADIAFAVFLVFARVGGMVMLMPGFGEPSVPARVRLAFALALALALAPVVAPSLPPPPASNAGLVLLVAQETVLGVALGAATRMVLSALAVAGQTIGMQTGMALAQTFDPAQGQQGALFAAFLTVAGMALIFALGLHHGFLEALRSSYVMLPAGGPPPVGDFSQLGLDTVADGFRVGVQMAAPLLVFGLVFYLGIGVLSRLMPQAQIFFVAMPSTILFGMAIFAVTVGGALLVWADYVEDFTAGLI